MRWSNGLTESSLGTDIHGMADQTIWSWVKPRFAEAQSRLVDELGLGMLTEFDESVHSIPVSTLAVKRFDRLNFIA